MFYLLIVAEDEIEEDESGDDDDDESDNDNDNDNSSYGRERGKEVIESEKETEKSHRPIKPDSKEQKKLFSSKRSHLHGYGKIEIDLCLLLSFERNAEFIISKE